MKLFTLYQMSIIPVTAYTSNRLTRDENSSLFGKLRPEKVLYHWAQEALETLFIKLKNKQLLSANENS